MPAIRGALRGSVAARVEQLEAEARHRDQQLGAVAGTGAGAGHARPTRPAVLAAGEKRFETAGAWDAGRPLRVRYAADAGLAAQAGANAWTGRAQFALPALLAAGKKRLEAAGAGAAGTSVTFA